MCGWTDEVDREAEPEAKADVKPEAAPAAETKQEPASVPKDVDWNGETEEQRTARKLKERQEEDAKKALKLLMDRRVKAKSRYLLKKEREKAKRKAAMAKDIEKQKVEAKPEPIPNPDVIPETKPNLGEKN